MTFDRIDMNELEKELIEFRRDLHTYPESGWTEFRTTAKIITELEKLGLPVRFGREIHSPESMYGMPKPEALEECYERALAESDRPELIEKMKGGYTGCVTMIEGALPGPTIGIRVDIDCNDVSETEDFDHKPVMNGFRSKHKNCMHACGHDAHTAIGLGTAKILSAYKDVLKGRVMLVFQPAEEGLRGAASLTATGMFKDCDYFFGAHIGLKSTHLGMVAASSTGFLASTKFDAVFHGASAHAGLAPNLGKNAMAAASTAVLNMLAIPRHQDGSSRINIGTFRSGTGRNVVPEYAELTIETRGITSEINEYMEKSAKRVCQASADMYECGLDINFMGSAGGIVCDPEVVSRAREILEGVDGVDEVIEDFDFGAGEDVCTIMKAVQSHGGKVTEMVFGMPLIAPHHNNRFDLDERVIGIGARSFASIALEIEG